MSLPPNLDRVQVAKWESPSGGGTDTDSYPTSIKETEDALSARGMYFQPADPGVADEDVLVWRDGSDLKFQDKVVGPYKLSELSGGGLTADAHKIVRQLIHFIEEGPGEGFASGAYKEVTGTVTPTSIVWWESSAKLVKIVERLITWSGVMPTQDQWKVYDSGGNLIATVTDAISYSGVFETSRTRTITVP